MDNFGYLEHRLDDLIGLCQQLADENQALRHREADLVQERAKLLKKNQLARERITTIIDKLKHMEEDAATGHSA